MLKKKVDNKLFLIIFVLISALLMVPIVNAGVFNDIYNWITGRASQATTVTVAVGNEPPIIGNVSIESSYSITANGNTTILFSFIVTDPEGAENIDITSARANITNGTGGGMTRYNDTAFNSNDGNCVNDTSNDYNTAGNAVNFSCSVNLVFYDTAIDWNVSVFVQDKNSNTAQNNTVTFNVPQTTSFVIEDGAVNFPTGIAPNDENITQSDIIALNNTGNDLIETNKINITALQLHGDSVTTTFIPAQNFTASTISGVSSCDTSDSSNVATLVNKTNEEIAPYFNQTIVPGASLSIGAYPNNEELLYLCIIHVPSDLTTQDYSTTGDEENWEIVIF